MTRPIAVPELDQEALRLISGLLVSVTYREHVPELVRGLVQTVATPGAAGQSEVGEMHATNR